MAERPVFVPRREGPLLVLTQMTSFRWYPGMSLSQKQRSISALHDAAVSAGICSRPLDISSKSPVEVGTRLSAFYLGSTTPKNQYRFTVETAFQSSKVFESGGPYRDLLHVSSREAKKDKRLQKSGRLLRFEFFGDVWSLEPRTAFYDWLYINTLLRNPALIDELYPYDAFTDIEFNPERSINCQAYSAALFKSLSMRGLLTQALSGKSAFLDIVSSKMMSNSHERTDLQPRLV